MQRLKGLETPGASRERESECCRHLRGKLPVTLTLFEGSPLHFCSLYLFSKVRLNVLYILPFKTRPVAINAILNNEKLLVLTNPNAKWLRDINKR
jgi:hypothetical protein